MDVTFPFFFQGLLATKNIELVAAAKAVEKLLRDMSENTAIAEKEKSKVATIVNQVTAKAQVLASSHWNQL
jgi:dynein heavy chain, axonemal